MLLKRSALFAAGVVLVGFLLWIFVEAEPPRDSLKRGLAPGGEVVGQAEGDDLSRELPEVEAIVRSSNPNATASTDAPREPAAAAKVFELHLVDEGGAPVPDAQVLVIEGASEAQVAEFKSSSEVDGLMRQHGKARAVDSEGVLDVQRPRADEPTLLVASTDRLWGSLLLEAEGPNRLYFRLHRDDTLRVQLVSSAGAPLPGEEIQLFNTAQRTHASRSAETLGEDGIATFPHLQESLKQPGDWSLSVDAVLIEPIDIGLDAGALPAEVLRVQLPPTGSLGVHVFAEDGAPLAVAAELDLRVNQDEAQRPFDWRERPAGKRSARKTSGSIAHFSLVEIGCDLEIIARRSGVYIETRSVIQGPDRSGEEKSVELRLGTGNPVVRFRAVDADYKPLALVELQGASELAGRAVSSQQQVRSSTDAQGYAILDIGGAWSEGTRRTVELTLGSEQDSELRARIELSRTLPPGVNELGEVVFLDEFPALVAGRVVDTTGAPVRKARVRLYGRNAGEETWSSLYSPTRRADEDGRFVMRHNPPGDEFCIIAFAGTQHGALVEFARGDQDVEVAIAEAGVITGDVLLDAHVDPGDVWARIEGDSLARFEPGRTAKRDSLDDDGRFEFDGLPAGSYELQVGVGDESNQLVSVPDVIVNEGEATSDPRLVEIDLRGRLHLHRVSLDWRGTGEAPNWSCCARSVNGGEWTSGSAFSGQDIELLSAHERIDLMAFSKGYSAASLTDVSGEVSVSLGRPAIPVRLRLRLLGDAQLPAAPVSIKAQLVPHGLGRHGADDWQGPGFDENGEAVISAPGPGRMDVTWRLMRKLGGSTTFARAEVAKPITVEVQDAQAEQAIEVQLSAADIEKLLGATL